MVGTLSFVIDDIVRVYRAVSVLYRHILLQNIYFQIRIVATDHKSQALPQKVTHVYDNKPQVSIYVVVFNVGLMFCVLNAKYC